VIVMTAPTAGLRERKKVATRQALHEAAVRLAVEHGLERLTVEAIADAADVSRRTFSNYFPNKEEALLWSDRVRIVRLLELVAQRPDGEPPWQAMSAAALELVTGSAHDPRWTAQVRLLRRHPSLLAQQVAQYADAERGLVELLTARLPQEPDAPLRARLLAATLLTTLRVAVQQWIEDPATPLPGVLARALTLAAPADPPQPAAAEGR
jgi:AcrR family transcriptional regulator